jgi:hypothetical protein
MATFAIGGAVIGTVVELLTDGSSLKKSAFGDNSNEHRKVLQ